MFTSMRFERRAILVVDPVVQVLGRRVVTPHGVVDEDPHARQQALRIDDETFVVNADCRQVVSLEQVVIGDADAGRADVHGRRVDVRGQGVGL